MGFTTPTAMSGQYYSDGGLHTGLGFTLLPSGAFTQHYCKYSLTVTDPEGVSDRGRDVVEIGNRFYLPFTVFIFVLPSPPSILRLMPLPSYLPYLPSFPPFSY